MFVLLDDHSGCHVASNVRPRDRLLVRLHGSRLDNDLARGASPDATVALALRAQMLLDWPEFGELIRRPLAAGPVSARGVARSRVLLSDARGPLDNRASTDDLRARVRDAADALSAA
jgi:hypothetical protein